MKFSYSLIKKLAPGKYDKATLVEKLNLHSFETSDLGGDILEAAVPPNRYSDAASHLGVAREAAAIFGLKLKDPTLKLVKSDRKEPGVFTVNVKDKKLCSRYMAAHVSNIKVGPSPAWLRSTLESGGLRPINNVVDIMNYVMLELGQPMHAFDADKISGGIIVRTAKKEESLETIDSQKFNLSPEILVIADARAPQAIAGIKGGKLSEVTAKTKSILVEAANFNGVNIYQSSRKLGLVTDASARFSHQLSPELVFIAMHRALSLLKELAGGKIYRPVDVYSKKQSRKFIKLDFQKINNLIGHNFKLAEALAALQALGFKKISNKVEIPALRTDISSIEDLAEEVARLYGFNNLAAKAPIVSLGAASQEEQITLKDRLRNFLTSAGASEVYNYSFLSRKEAENQAVELANPMSSQSEFLRDSLLPALVKNLESNSRFFDAVRIFEIGHTFRYAQNNAENTPKNAEIFPRKSALVEERLRLGVGIAAKNSHLELKGLVDSLFGSLGITEYETQEKTNNSLDFIVDGVLVGFLKLVSVVRNGAVLELDLDELLKIIEEEREFKPLPKFPSITRDLSIFVPEEIRVGEILALIQRVSSKLVADVDLIDFYEPPLELRPKQDRGETQEKRRKSLTFRLVFQAEDRTLTDAEADREMAIINQIVTEKFDAELR